MIKILTYYNKEILPSIYIGCIIIRAHEQKIQVKSITKKHQINIFQLNIFQLKIFTEYYVILKNEKCVKNNQKIKYLCTSNKIKFRNYDSQITLHS